MTITNAARDESVVRYDDRLPVHGRALLPVIAIGMGAGLIVFYIARILAERAPMELEPVDAASERAATHARTRG